MRVLRNETTDRYEANPTLLRKFPEQLRVSFGEGTFHLGGDEHASGVDPRREGYPAGQAVGAIESLEPAGQIVHDMVDQATAILARLNDQAH
jgi:enoyl-[acyl-carrier protein] reductase II